MDFTETTRCLHRRAGADLSEEERRVIAHYKMVLAVGYSLRGPHFTEDDFQNGSIGLLEAVRDYDPSRGLAFSTYAYFRVRNAITHGWRERQLKKPPPRFCRAVFSGAHPFFRIGHFRASYISPLETEDEWFIAWAALRVLDEQDMALVCGYYLDGLNCKELGLRHKLSHAWTSSRLRSAMKDVRTIAAALSGN